jgi:hypothetical protein
LVYDADWDEDARLAERGSLVEQTHGLPPTLAAAIAVGRNAIQPLQHSSQSDACWGQLRCGSARGAARHLVCVNTGLRQIPLEQRRARHPDSAGGVQLQAIGLAAQSRHFQ